MKQLIAILIILGLTLMNISGVKISQYFATTFTALKLMALAFIIAIGFLFAGRSDHDLVWSLTEQLPEDMMSLALLAFVGVFWSVGGWYHATFLSSETINAQRNVPRAMIIGTLTVTTVYVLTVASFMYLVPPHEMAVSSRIAGDALESVFSWGGKLVSVIIAVSIFGTIGIYTMTAPRIYFAMAKDGIFFKSLANIHPRFRTPHIAMLMQAVWAVVLVLVWGSFIKIITFVTFMDIVFMTLGTFSIFIIRKRFKDRPPYKMKWYPLIPIVFFLFNTAFVINTAMQLPTESFAGVAILLIGIPVYFYYKKKNLNINNLSDQ